MLASLAGLGSRLLGGRLAVEPAPPSVDLFRPHVGARRWGWTHYGVMVPDVPAPHGFLACMALLGATGSRAFDTDHARRGSPRRHASVVTGSAVTAPDRALRSYVLGEDAFAAPDGAWVELGDDVAFRRTGDAAYDVDGPGWSLSLGLRLEHTTWFLRSPFWDHVSVLADVRGTVGEVAVDTLGTFEWARCALSPHQLLDVPLPGPLKVPFTGFHYHVVDLGDGRQLLLGHNELLGAPALTAAYLRGGTLARPVRWTSDVRYEVLAHADADAVAPDGRRMRVPSRFRWSLDGALDLVGEVDGPLLYGLGSGYVGGYRHHGVVDGVDVAGRGYLEWIDR